MAKNSNRDLSDAMSSLNLAQTNTLQDQRQRETLRHQYGAKPTEREPLTAPTPNRAPVSPPSASPGIWSPEMGINFGGPAPRALNNNNIHNPAYPNTRGGQTRGGQWNPSQGVKFG